MSDAETTLRIVRGDASPEDVAVLTALLAATGGGDEPEPPVLRGGWRDPARQHRRQLHPGPGAWRSSGSYAAP
ncbi:acyl-CoA carboxylase subunit epsilon [uncultured Jatrophihabitans sp.]|uniref:acyl-CoA carboxylase subunit epsilon n=1 Tax=uncultured Jatrophihabitans sp. TaxID=1610747 RepID=UPI0035CC4D93